MFRSDAIDSKPINVDFTNQTNWEVVFPDPEYLDETIVENIIGECGDPELFEEMDDEERCEYLSELIMDHHDFAPLMNYAYPLPGFHCDPSEVQASLFDNTCILVLIDQEPFLALRGGGMDLSWDICAAYIALGYYPPIHFSDLPLMAGHNHQVKQTIIKAMRQSIHIAKSRLESSLSALDRAESYDEPFQVSDGLMTPSIFTPLSEAMAAY